MSEVRSISTVHNLSSSDTSILENNNMEVDVADASPYEILNVNSIAVEEMKEDPRYLQIK